VETWLGGVLRENGPHFFISCTLERCRAEETQVAIIVYNLGTSTC
jgi:hypothetical protein